MTGLLAVIALGGVLGCASPRSFDPSENGQSYTDSSYTTYQSCLNNLAPTGYAASCQGGGYSRGYSVAALTRPSAETQRATLAYVRALPEAQREAQEEAWRELADQGRRLQAERLGPGFGLE